MTNLDPAPTAQSTMRLADVSLFHVEPVGLVERSAEHCPDD
jgi:hypothetical protein